MFLAIDVGNTHTVIGVYQDQRLERHWRLQTDKGRTADELGLILHGLFDAAQRASISGIGVSSTVPTLTKVVEETCHTYLGRAPLVMGPGVRTGMPIFYDNPREVGADRIANAIAAYERTRNATIVVDFGTATILDYISAKGEYMGGVIAPGVGTASDALFERAAKLYRVEFIKPLHVVGRTTVHAIQSGVIYGYVALVDGIVQRIRKETGAAARVMATGSYASLLAPESETIESVDEFLTLDGLRIVYERNQQ